MKSVLIIDDEQSFVLSLELLLKRAGFKVMTAYSGEDGLILAKDAHPDIIILDIMMPGMGGLGTLQLLKSFPVLKKIPVILISGARPLARQAEYKWADFLHKPCNPKDLLTVLRHHLEED